MIQLKPILLCGVLLGIAIPATAQNNSLIQPYTQQRPLTMADVNLIRPVPVGPRVIKLHDKISVRVEELARTLAEGEVQQRKNVSINAVLLDWVRLNGLRKAEPTQLDGIDPRIQGQIQQLARNQSDWETSERLTLNIAAEVADVRPNGHLVIEASKEIHINNELWLVTLTGRCRQEDVGLDNVVLSSDIMDLRIVKKEKGRVRDGYRRGWLHRFIDQVNPF